MCEPNVVHADRYMFGNLEVVHEFIQGDNNGHGLPGNEVHRLRSGDRIGEVMSYTSLAFLYMPNGGTYMAATEFWSTSDELYPWGAKVISCVKPYPAFGISPTKPELTDEQLTEARTIQEAEGGSLEDIAERFHDNGAGLTHQPRETD